MGLPIFGFFLFLDFFLFFGFFLFLHRRRWFAFDFFFRFNRLAFAEFLAARFLDRGRTDGLAFAQLGRRGEGGAGEDADGEDRDDDPEGEPAHLVR